jgi:hypothetical protein
VHYFFVIDFAGFEQVVDASAASASSRRFFRGEMFDPMPT